MPVVTLQDCMDRARLDLQDDKVISISSPSVPDGVRYPDAKLLLLLQNALREAYLSRPDLFYSIRNTGGGGAAGTALFMNVDFSTYLATTPWPIDQQWVPVFSDYVAGRAQFRDDEAVLTQRASAFYFNFRSGESR
jgi:hypothetical protein